MARLRELGPGLVKVSALSLLLFQIRRIIQATAALQAKAKHDGMTVKVLEI